MYYENNNFALAMILVNFIWMTVMIDLFYLHLTKKNDPA